MLFGKRIGSINAILNIIKQDDDKTAHRDVIAQLECCKENNASQFTPHQTNNLNTHKMQMINLKDSISEWWKVGEKRKQDK